MLNSIFPITENWSWITFLLYLTVSFLTVKLCKQGLRRIKDANNGTTLTSSKNAKVESGFFFFTAWAVLVILATIRDETVGTDTKNYIPYFLSTTSVEYNWKMFFSFQQREPGYQYYIYLVRSITDNYTVLFFITYSFIAFAYISFIKHTWKYEDNSVPLYIFIFYYASNMSGMRSAIGASFLLFSFLEMKNRSYFKAFLLTICGVMFHYTMIFNIYILLFHWLMSDSKIRERKSLWITLIGLTIIFSNVGIYFLQGVLSSTKYDYYTVDIAETSLLGSMFFVVLGALCIYYYKEIINRDSTSNSNLIICMCLLAAYPLLFVTGAYRIPNYYILPRLYIWSIIIEELEKKVSGRAIPLFHIGTRTAMLLFLLLRFTKSSVDGGFIYHIK